MPKTLKLTLTSKLNKLSASVHHNHSELNHIHSRLNITNHSLQNVINFQLDQIRSKLLKI
jgi:hypothetical protein